MLFVVVEVQVVDREPMVVGESCVPVLMVLILVGDDD